MKKPTPQDKHNAKYYAIISAKVKKTRKLAILDHIATHQMIYKGQPVQTVNAYILYCIKKDMDSGE